jgi:hypothetical protein
VSTDTPDPESGDPRDEAGDLAAQGVPVEIHPPHPAAHSFKDFLIQLVTITAGVLIALSIESVREWNHYRTLVAEAREMIRRELADNKKEVEGVLNGIPERQKNLVAAIQLADELLAKKEPTVHQLALNFELADLSEASWQTAERTGALSHMDYAEVQNYSRLYGRQELYSARQRLAVDQLGLAMGILQADPTEATPRDLELFRQRVIELRATLGIEEQLAQRLVKEYEEIGK